MRWEVHEVTREQGTGSIWGRGWGTDGKGRRAETHCLVFTFTLPEALPRKLMPEDHYTVPILQEEALVHICPESCPSCVLTTTALEWSL